MLTLLSTLISFLMGGLPKILDFFQDRADKLHELALAQMQITRELELRKAGFEAQERIEHYGYNSGGKVKKGGNIDRALSLTSMYAKRHDRDAG